MPAPLEEEYFIWLCAKVLNNVHQPEYVDLLRIFQRYEFVPLIPGDPNRAEEGMDVRHQFLDAAHYGRTSEWDHIGCSMLEMFIGLSKRAAWQTSIPEREWFWKIMENLGLGEFRRIGPSDVQVVEDILYAIVWRTYDDNGNGGMFPLRTTQYDQRMIEIWYQFCEYVAENDLV